MAQKNYHKILAGFLIFIFIAGPVLISPKPAHAQLIVKDPFNLVFNTLTAGNTTVLSSKESVLDAVAYALAGSLLRALTNAIVQWIRTGGIRGDSLYVQDFGQAFQQELDNSAGVFLETFLGPRVMNAICSPFRIPLGNLLNTAVLGDRYNTFSQRARCSLTQIVSNVENFRVDFYQGGWPAWEALLVPAGSWTGTYLLGLDEYQRQQAEAFFKLQTELQTTGGGLRPQKKCDTTSVGNLVNCVITKPGQTVAEAVKSTFNIDVDRLKLADEINEIVAAALESLVSWAVSGGGGFESYNPREFVNRTQPPPPPGADQAPPTVSITSPTASSTVSGQIDITANASDNIRVRAVEFRLDGSLLNEDRNSPYLFRWNTRNASSGPHTLSAVASDTSGNAGTSTDITIFVNNP